MFRIVIAKIALGLFEFIKGQKILEKFLRHEGYIYCMCICECSYIDTEYVVHAYALYGKVTASDSISMMLVLY